MHVLGQNIPWLGVEGGGGNSLVVLLVNSFERVGIGQANCTVVNERACQVEVTHLF